MIIFKNCLLVKEVINNQNVLLMTYYAEKIGPVLIEEYSTIDNGAFLLSKTELLGYSFGGLEGSE